MPDLLTEISNAINYYVSTAVSKGDIQNIRYVFNELYYVVNVEQRPLDNREFDAMLRLLGIHDRTLLVQQYSSLSTEQKLQILQYILQLVDNALRQVHANVNYY